MLTPRDIIFHLKPCSWTYNDIMPELGDKTHFGFIAQDLLESFGSDYGFVDETGQYLKVNYMEFIGPLVKVIQEQDKRIQELEQQIGALNERVGL